MRINQTPPDGCEPSDLVNATPEVRKRRKRREAAPPTRRVYDTVETAAAKLGLDPAALRARLRRAQRLENGSIVADLGGGIRGFKFGKSWRIRFPEG
ncbi:MAG TPA: hypothetical protein VFK05_18500 [Polyangiaceae bacterium]|nr:hypothetical protein [Polyangiaceae bacterium]